MTRRATIAICLLLATGCTAPGQGHREQRVWAGFRPLGIDLVTVAEYELKELSTASAAAGDRLTEGGDKAPISLLSTDSSGFHLLKAGPSDEQAKMIMQERALWARGPRPPAGAHELTTPASPEAAGGHPENAPGNGLVCEECGDTVRLTEAGRAALKQHGLAPKRCGPCELQGGRRR